MKTIIITDPCYTTEGSSEGGSAEVKIEVSDGFFNVLKQEPIVKFNPDDNWDGGTYFFGGKHPIGEYDYVGDHFNDAGMTCIADYDHLQTFDWSDFLDDDWWPICHKMYSCKSCNGTGENPENGLSDSTVKLLEDIDESVREKAGISQERIEEMKKHFSRCSHCYGKGEREGSDLSATINNSNHFLMVGSTFLGDVGASVWVRRDDDGIEINALVIDVVGYTFGNADHEDD